MILCKQAMEFNGCEDGRPWCCCECKGKLTCKHRCHKDKRSLSCEHRYDTDKENIENGNDN